jgi:hypothetical protein
MQLRLNRETIVIIPETDQDVAFLEDTMRLRNDGDIVKFERIDDPSKNWIKFRVESYTSANYWHDEEVEEAYEGSAPKRVDISRFKDFGDDEEPTSDFGTLVDVEA